jgi:hypothetical protein
MARRKLRWRDSFPYRLMVLAALSLERWELFGGGRKVMEDQA